jgi:hypothetical protein
VEEAMTTSQASSAITATTPVVRGRRIWAVGLLAVVAAVAINLIVGLSLRVALGVDSRFLPLTPGPIVFFTVIPTVLCIPFYQLLRVFTRRPDTVFTVIAVVLTVLSLAAPLSLLGASSADWVGLTKTAALALIPLHLLLVAVMVFALTRLVSR